MRADRMRTLARVLLAVAGIGGLLVIGAQLVAPPVSATATVRSLIDAIRFVGPPLALVGGLLALLRARGLDRGVSTPRPAADSLFRALVGVALTLMIVGVLTGLWTTLVLTLGALLR
jgi:hypothetical protein